MKKKKKKKFKYIIGIDFETVDLKEGEGSIVEVGICLWDCRKKCRDEMRIVSSYKELFKPDLKITKGATRSHRITNKDVEKLKPYNDTWDVILTDWLEMYGKNIPIVGHNLAFERKHAMAQGSIVFKLHEKYYDTMKQLPDEKGKWVSLEKMVDKHLPKKSIFRGNFHRALDDAIMSCAIAQKLLVNKVKPWKEDDLLS